MTRQPDLTDLQRKLGWTFRDVRLLQQALTHKSWSNEHPGVSEDNERLEFLGDAVLDLVVGQALFSHPERYAEGELTRSRAELVNERGLALLARGLGLGERLRLGRGERLSGGGEKDSLLANAFEALIGALFLDAGYEGTKSIVEQLFSGRLEAVLEDRQGQDYKSRLQELLQGRFGAAPSYRELRVDGPAHERSYTIALEFQGRILAEGVGRSKKEAEQSAARQALEALDE